MLIWSLTWDKSSRNGLFALRCDLALDFANTMRWWQLNPLASPVISKAELTNLLSPSKDLKRSQKAVFAWKAHFVLGPQLVPVKGNDVSRLHSAVIEFKVCPFCWLSATDAQSSVECHTKVPIFATLTPALYYAAHCSSEKSFAVYFKRNLHVFLARVCLCSPLFPFPLTRWQKAVNLFIHVLCLCTLTVSCKAPLTGCREWRMKEGSTERKRGCCCCLFSLSAPLGAWRSE